jgi:hypothetical protein
MEMQWLRVGAVLSTHIVHLELHDQYLQNLRERQHLYASWLEDAAF